MAPDMPRARKGAPFFLPQALRLQVCMGRRLSSFLLIAALACASLPAAAAPSTSARKAAPAARQPAAPPPRDGQAESRLIEAYRLVGQGRRRDALAHAERLVRDYPQFQLAQLLYGDLLATQVPPGKAVPGRPEAGAPLLRELQQEAQLRLQALRERPPAGAIPAQFLALAPNARHAIAVDASRARLYLFENGPHGPQLVADYYVSVGKQGVEKVAEGDMRTPLGVYFIGSNLDPKSLKDFYGAGALTLNYPNPYDLRRGKTGSGIWVHGTPPEQYSRAPQATDGCVVMANTDLARLLRTVEVRSTPVVIARQLQWVAPQSLQAERHAFTSQLQAWQQAKRSGDLQRLLSFYASDFASYDKSLADWTPVLQREVQKLQGRNFALKDLSYLRWGDSADTMVVTFGEVAEGARTGPVKRQYWLRQGGGAWKIFFEGVIG